MKLTAWMLFGVILIIAATILMVFRISHAESLKPEAHMLGKEGVCPVMGGKVKITEHTPVVEYKGQRYYFCCPGCDKDFMKDPEKYIAQAHVHEAVATELNEVDVGLKATCPVTGDSFTVHKETPVVSYKDEKYHFCCPGCDKEFIKDPEKYIKEESGQPEQEINEIEYWTCSMHPEVKADEDGNCPICGMSLIPIYKKTGSEKSLYMDDKTIELAGIKMIAARKTPIYKEIQAVGKVAYDPDLVIAQEEFLNALEMKSLLEGSDSVTVERARNVVEKSKYKLRLLGMDEAEINNLKRTKKVETSLILPDQETWVYADMFESDIGWVKKNQSVIIESIAYPGEEFVGKIKSINPILNTRTRSVQVRISLSSQGFILRPGMYVDVKIRAKYHSPVEQDVLSVPKTSVLDTGNRKIVWVYLGDGYFEPREVKIGTMGVIAEGEHSEQYYPILSGLKEGESVVTNGNFLIDSESQLTGVAALQYGGAVGIEEEKSTLQFHQH